MEKVNYHVCGLKPPICEEMLKFLWFMRPHVHSNLIDIARIIVAKECTQKALIKL